jgi:hypothetical protein
VEYPVDQTHEFVNSGTKSITVGGKYIRRGFLHVTHI